jgi:hypothetical protein
MRSDNNEQLNDDHHDQSSRGLKRQKTGLEQHDHDHAQRDKVDGYNNNNNYNNDDDDDDDDDDDMVFEEVDIPEIDPDSSESHGMTLDGSFEITLPSASALAQK